MANEKQLHGWKDGAGKFYLSRFPADAPRRPANRYDTLRDAMRDAGQRGLRIQWADGAADQPEAAPVDVPAEPAPK